MKQEINITIVFSAKFQCAIIIHGKLGGEGISLPWPVCDGIELFVEQYSVQRSDSQKYGTQNHNIIYEPITHNNLQC